MDSARPDSDVYYIISHKTVMDKLDNCFTLRDVRKLVHPLFPDEAINDALLKLVRENRLKIHEDSLYAMGANLCIFAKA